MAEKMLNTRIQLKYDTYENWVANNPVLKAGEVAIATVATNTGGVKNAPSVLFKVGDGTSTYTALKFVSGLAADVSAWAKAASKPTYNATEITGIDQKIADYVTDQMGISVDTDTQYQIVKVDSYNYKLQSKGKTDAAWTDVAGGAIAIPKYDDTTVKNDISSLKTLVGTTAVATQIANAITALKLADTYEAKGTAATEAGKVLGTSSDAATANTVYGAKAAAAKAQGEVDALEGKVGTVPTGKTVVQMIADAQAAATYDDTTLKNRVSTVEGKVTTLIGSDAGKSARTIANEELAKQLIPSTAQESLDTLAEIAAWIQAHPDDVATMNAAITKLQAIVDGIGDTGEKATVVAYVTDAINALNISSYAKASVVTALTTRVDTLEGKAHTHANMTVLNGITTAKVSAWDAKANDADLKAIAKTGNVNDLVQTTGDVLVFNCGTSAI